MEALTRELDRHDRLVLLGDVVEFQEAHPEHSLRFAEPVLRAIAERLGPDKELLLVAGNHDHDLVRDWALAQGEGLALEGQVPTDATEALARVCGYMGATKVTVHYPGLWLAPGVWAVHGHYLANYLQPVSSWGVHLRRSSPRPATPAELEQPSRPRAHMHDGLPPQRWIDRHIPQRMSALSSRLLGHQMLRHALPAFAASVSALGVQADWVVFGHVHRRGPLERDDARRWRVAASGPRLINTGSWRYEPVVARGLDGRCQYWPGGAVTIGEDGVPRCVGLLDSMSEADLLAEL
jgi:hypothetical protein